MLKNLLTTISVFTMILMLAPACAEHDQDAEAAKSKPAAETAAATPTAQTAPQTAVTGEEMSIMDTPVNFSTPEDVEKSIEAVRQQAGEKQARALSNAMGYILAYDLSIGNDKAKMYQKLNGKTPNAIIAKMKR